ncbi:hypothetical protein RIF23_16705 [Lipingzhangella sp. LS1_29]|uniref:DUF4232 domain-containing protein n=1 Tax=Lipingzhangella rawalii TaxID=2055835 RepID=A0ABU2HAR6_9ACTN|nr:hypothetical protein [Lipingzhangella rawalii]MDS1271935.1 hypothetical protein [Lipingzhangella rawalii]
MASSAGHPGPVSPETYWKRRVFVLAGLFAIVALIAWASSALSSSGTDDEQQASADPEAGAETDEPEEPPDPGPTGNPEPDTDSDGDADDDNDEDSEDSEDEDADSGEESGQDGDSGSTGIPEPESAEDPCRPQDIVVTMDLAEDTFTGGADVEVELTVVNTGEQTCTVDMGPEEMELRVTSGDDRIFSTADCADGDDAQPTELQRGVPHTTTVTWDRTRSWSDCRDSDRTAGNGTYVLRFISDYDEGVDNEVFRLR